MRVHPSLMKPGIDCDELDEAAAPESVKLFEAVSAYQRAREAMFYAEKARKEADILIARSRQVLLQTDDKLAKFHKMNLDNI